MKYSQCLTGLCKYLFLLYFGGATYVTIEVFYRQYSHWSMFVCGAVAFVTCGLINNILKWETPLLLQMLAGTAVILSLEFMFGLILNVWLGMGIWDYSDKPLNLMGQVCPQYTAYWYGLSGVAIVLDDILRWRFFGECKPYYTIFGKRG